MMLIEFVDGRCTIALSEIYEVKKKKGVTKKPKIMKIITFTRMG